MEPSKKRAGSSSLEEIYFEEIKSSLSTTTSIKDVENETLTFNNDLKTIFQKVIDKIDSEESKTHIKALFEKLTETKKNIHLKFVLDKLAEPKANLVDVQVYFDYENNKLFVVKRLCLKNSDLTEKAAIEVINGYRINAIENSEGFVNTYSFYLEGDQDDEKYLNIVMDLCECSLSDYLKFLINEINIMDETEKKEVCNNLILMVHQITASLKKLSQLKLIHGDIKEENILLMKNLNSNFTMKIADFETVLSYDEYLERKKLRGMTKGYVPENFFEKKKSSLFWAKFNRKSIF